jgi:hypothetical protein
MAASPVAQPDHHFEPHPDEKRSRLSCRHCGRVPDVHPDPPPPEYVERDLAAEHAVLTDAVTGSALDASALWAYASGRAHPGGIKVGGRSLRREVLEELADAAHYVVWEVCYVLQPRARAGDSVAAERIPSRLGAIRKLIEVWDILHLP